MEIRRIEFESNKKGLVDICILAHQRLGFTKLLFERLLKNTDFDLVEKVIIVHDFPDKENTEFLMNQVEELKKFGIGIIYRETKNGAVVPGMKFGMMASKSKYFLKIDNDVVPGTGWTNRLIDCMESYPELVLLGYSRIWEDNFPKEKIVMKEGLDYGYLKCYNNVPPKWFRNEDFEKKVDVSPTVLRVHVGGLMIMRMEQIRPTLRYLISKSKFFGWPQYQFKQIKPLGVTGWYYPTIDETLILDKLKDRTVFDKAGLSYDELCRLVNEYYKKGWTRVRLEQALMDDQKSSSVTGRICLDV
jgi:hypothetical protein